MPCRCAAAFFAAVILMTGLLAAPARAQLGGWTMASFDARLEVEPDGTLLVTETIVADFSEPRHGIYREIPVRYAVGLHMYDIRFKLIGVDNGRGNARQTKTEFEGDRVKIRIGDPDQYVTGREVYRIRYRVERAILHEGDAAVLRWNATGTEWRVPIGGATVTVVLPGPLDDDQLSYTATTGRYGSRSGDYDASRPDDSSIRFTTGPLDPFEGITVDVAMPGEAVAEASWLAWVGWWLVDNFAYFLIPLTLGLCVLAWRQYGRDVPGRGTIVVEYSPPDELTPAEVGTLIDERVDMRDISATVVDLAVRGYLRIEEMEEEGFLGSTKDYRFHKLRDGKDLRPFEETLFDKLFSGRDRVRLSDLKETFYPAVGTAKERLYRSLKVREYFDGNPDTVRSQAALVGVIGVALASGLIALFQYIWIGRVFPAPLIIAGIVSLLVVLVTSRVMPRKTRKGRLAWEKIKGLEEYIRRAEVDDLKAQERQGIFERLLPFAIAFGLTDRWSEAFEGLYEQPPEWYQSPRTGFTTAYLASSLDHSVNRMNTVLPSQPRSSGSSGGGFSGGGFSGGGFGGGGGGSW